MDPKHDHTRPASIDLDRRRALRITWGDGHETELLLPELRRACPCATCRAAREERSRNPLTVVAATEDPAAMVVARDAELVGNYALRITWADGHATGMYDFRMLREMCPCATCAGRRS